MKKIRINVLARELEVKSHLILDLLPDLGVSEKLTHSSSIDEDVADKLRIRFGIEPVGNGAPLAEFPPQAQRRGEPDPPPEEASVKVSAPIRPPMAANPPAPPPAPARPVVVPARPLPIGPRPGQVLSTQPGPSQASHA